MNTFMGALLTILVIILILIYYFIYCIFSDINRIIKSLQQDRETFIKICDNIKDVIIDNKNIIKTNEELINRMGKYYTDTVENVHFIKQNMIRRKKPIID